MTSDKPRSVSAARWLWRALRAMLIYSLLVVFIALMALLFSERAPRWLWQQVQPQLPHVALDGLSGTLATGLQVQHVRWRNEAMSLAIDALSVKFNAAQLITGRMGIAELSAQRVAVAALTASEPSVFVPPSLDVPLAWALAGVHIHQLQWTAKDAQPVQWHDLTLTADGQGQQIAVRALTLRYGQDSAAVHLAAQAKLQLTAQWPMQATLTITPDAIPAQRITLSGDLSALRARLRGPAEMPIALDATVNALLPTLPFRGRVSWPQWQPPGQTDWRIEPGAMTFAGSTEQGELALDLHATLVQSATLPWPTNEPRQAQLSGPLRWQQHPNGLQARIDWRGSLGKAPWTVVARYAQAQRAETALTMRLADALLSAKGWPSSGLAMSLRVPRLQRFQSAIGGSLAAQGQWLGAWPAGEGRLALAVKQLAQPSTATALVNRANLELAGGVAQHRLSLMVDADHGRATLQAEGGLMLKTMTWRGRLSQAQIAPQQGRWQLQRPATLIVSEMKTQLERACWQQIDAQLSPWQLCTQADLSPKQWLASVTAQLPSGGSITANFRRDPQAAEPPLDADIRWQHVNLAMLPMALPEGLVMSGHSDGDIRVSGRLRQPELIGQWSVAARLDWPRYGLSWPTLSLDGRFTGQRSQWTAAVEDSNAGQLAITGQAHWMPALNVTMAVTGSRLAFAYAPWVQGQLSPKMTIAWQDQQLSVGGDVLVNQADITLKSLAAGAPKPSPDVVLVRARDGRVVTLSETPGGVALNLHVRMILGDAIALTGYGLNAGLRGQLLLTQAPRTALAATGEISLKPGAQFAAYGQRLAIEQGRLLFSGPLTTPDIRLSASREVDGLKVGVNVQGSAPKPTVTLTSDSPMSQDDILSYLVLGRALGPGQETTVADKQALALSAALNLTGKTGAVGLLGQRLGISDFAIGTQGESDATEVAVSGRLSPKLWLSIGRGVFQPSQSVTVRYQINRRLSLEALSALESAITLFYSWRF